MALVKDISIAVGIIFLIIGILFLCRYLIQRRTLREIRKSTAQNGLSCIEKLNLGGVDQWISIEARNRNNSILLLLHGDPGMPIPYGVGFRNRHQGITNSFVQVCWD